jgi:hypothetical protein
MFGDAKGNQGMYSTSQEIRITGLTKKATYFVRVYSKDKKEDVPELSHYRWDIIATTPNDKFTPFQSEYEGYMGNYGNTLDRWYHRAVVILWQNIDTQSIFLEFNPSKVITDTLRLAKNKTTWQNAIDSTKQFIPYWRGLKETPIKIRSIKSVFNLCIELNDIEIAFSLIIPITENIFNPKMALELGLLVKTFGKEFVPQLLKKWGKEDSYFSDLNIVDFDKLIIGLLKHKNDHVISFVEWCLSYRFDLLKKDHKSNKEGQQLAALRKASPVKIKSLIDNLKACFAANNLKTHKEIIEHILSDPHSYPAVEFSQQIIDYLKTKSTSEFKTWGFDSLLTQLLEQLRTEVIQSQRDPMDWGIKEKNICKCEYCKILNSFLQDKIINEKVWPLAKNHRQHIHQIIDQMLLPVTHKTTHEGTPHKLVLKKTKQLFTNNNIILKELNDAIKAILHLRKHY